MDARVLLLAVPLLVGGCTFGMTAEKFRAAHRPSGVGARLVTPAAEIAGELLEVRADALVVSTSAITWRSAEGRREVPERRLRLVPFPAIERSSFEQLGGQVQIRDGQAPNAAARERLRLASRFPYGIQPEALAVLLKAHGQTALEGIER